MQAVYDSGFVLGKGTASDFWSLLKTRSGLSGEETELTQRILDGFVLRRWIITIVEQLRTRGYRVGILSDQTHWLNELDARDHFFNKFDEIFNSYNIGKGKREPALFTEVTRQLGVSPGQILFIDDSESNIQRAHEAGWQTLHFVSKDQFLEDIRPWLTLP
ncbi:MAG: HAD family phosphatase, partial [Gammaproteobacteria bacterium]